MAGSWWSLLERYHWFVLLVAMLGWLFDCLDQQLFNAARVPPMPKRPCQKKPQTPIRQVYEATPL